MDSVQRPDGNKRESNCWLFSLLATRNVPSQPVRNHFARSTINSLCIQILASDGGIYSSKNSHIKSNTQPNGQMMILCFIFIRLFLFPCADSHYFDSQQKLFMSHTYSSIGALEYIFTLIVSIFLCLTFANILFIGWHFVSHLALTILYFLRFRFAKDVFTQYRLAVNMFSTKMV